MNEWKTLVKYNVPCDILLDIYEFERLTKEGDWVKTEIALFLILSCVIGDKFIYRYRKIEE